MTTKFASSWSLTAAFCLVIASANANVVINEVALSGSSNACTTVEGDQNDWLELWNSGADEFDLSGLVLHDDKGLADPDTFTFPVGTTMEADSYLVLCCNVDPTATLSGTGSDTTLSPLFGIGSSDTLSLLRIDGAVVETIAEVGPFPGVDSTGRVEPLEGEGVTYSLLDAASGLYNYTSTPTPAQPNVLSELPTQEEVSAARKAQLSEQNDAGISFFNFDRQGKPVADALDTVLELKITMDATDLDAMLQNPLTQVYHVFQSASLHAADGTELLALTSPGEIRTRGQEAISMAACMGAPLPFRLDLDATNETQTLFGVQRLYLRSSLYDPSHMREWVYPRMLARFGLPHVRSRMVNFYINDVLQGAAYTLMEIPEEEYVFARNFPDYDPSNFALFQTTPLTHDCGLYTSDQLETAKRRVSELDTPPYAFERGEHQVGALPQAANPTMEECQAAYDEYYQETIMADVVLAYVRNDEQCATTFMGEGLIDQELGTNNWDNEIENFINEAMSFHRCEPDCVNSNLAQEVDLENFLKTFAFFAVALNVESPMGNVNNHYLAQSESEEEKWKLVTFDFDKPGSPSCNEDVCNERLVKWSIARPTCESLESNQLVGPLLTNQTLHAQYITYVKEFLESVYTDAEFIVEIQNHASAIESTVKESFGGGANFDRELSPDAASWDSGTFPLLPTMKARGEEVQKQLDALDAGTFPRGPQPGVRNRNEPWEMCVDWELAEPDTAPCENGCQYDGCLMPEWEVPGFCDEGTGKCFHGTDDERCIGIADGDMYPGMVDRDGLPTFCRFAAGVAVSTSECLAEGTQALGADGSSSAAGGCPQIFGVASVFAILSQCLLRFLVL